MTFDEKANYLENYCDSQKSCRECPITGLCSGDAFAKLSESDIDEMIKFAGIVNPKLRDKQKQEAHDLEINAEIISGYCRQFMPTCKECPAKVVCNSVYPDGLWSARFKRAVSAKKQRAMLDAFEAALPPLDDDAEYPYTASRNLDIPDNLTRHALVYSELFDLYKRKNADYGDSFHKSYEEWGLTMAAIRIGDKYSRFSQLVHNGGNALVKDESIRDTLIDLANYAIMTVMELDEERNGKNGNEA